MSARNSFIAALMFSTLAWGSFQVYAEVCVPSGFDGFLYSLVAMDSSPCQLLFSIVSQSQLLYGATLASLLHCVLTFIADCMSRNNIPKPIKRH
jgi:hypothetical protein